MENSVAQDPPARGWPFLLNGICFFVLGFGIYCAQLVLGVLTTPWYVPILSTVGVVLMAVSLAQRRGVARSIALGLFIVICGFQWFFVAVLTKTPVYEGPDIGEKAPAFAAIAADSKAFTEKDLADSEKRTALIFYRGHW